MTIVVTICGAGNGAHVMMAHLGSAPGVETRVLEIRRADNLKAALAEAGNVVMCHNQVGDDATSNRYFTNIFIQVTQYGL